MIPEADKAALGSRRQPLLGRDFVAAAAQHHVAQSLRGSEVARDLSELVPHLATDPQPEEMQQKPEDNRIDPTSTAPCSLRYAPSNAPRAKLATRHLKDEPDVKRVNGLNHKLMMQVPTGIVRGQGRWIIVCRNCWKAMVRMSVAIRSQNVRPHGRNGRHTGDRCRPSRRHHDELLAVAGHCLARHVMAALIKSRT